MKMSHKPKDRFASQAGGTEGCHWHRKKLHEFRKDRPFPSPSSFPATALQASISCSWPPLMLPSPGSVCQKKPHPKPFPSRSRLQRPRKKPLKVTTVICHRRRFKMIMHNGRTRVVPRAGRGPHGTRWSIEAHEPKTTITRPRPRWLPVETS